MILRRDQLRRAGAASPTLLTLRRRWATLRTAGRRHGPPGVMVACATLIPTGLLSVEWYALLATTCAGHAELERRDLAFRWGSRADLALLTSFGRSAREIEDRMARGDRVFIALEGDRLVGYTWFRSGAWTENEITFPLRDDELWAYDAFVAADQRGRHVHRTLCTAASAELHGEGVRRYVSGIDHLNAPSMRSASRRGADVLGSVLVVGVARMGMLRLSGRGRRRRALFRRRKGAIVSLGGV